MSSRLPTPGGDNDNWGTILNDYLQQALASDGTLLTTATNSYTSSTNTNLANSTRPGLVQLTGDLGTPYSAPKVTGLQGNAVAATAPTDGQVLVWSAANSAWQPGSAGVGGGGGSRSVSSGSGTVNAGSSSGTDYVYLVSGTSTLNLPAAGSNTNRYTVTNTGTATVTVAAASGDTIEGGSTASMPIANMSLDFISDGNHTWIVA